MRIQTYDWLIAQLNGITKRANAEATNLNYHRQRTENRAEAIDRALESLDFMIKHATQARDEIRRTYAVDKK